jgi:hypothetical protein
LISGIFLRESARTSWPGYLLDFHPNTKPLLAVYGTIKYGCNAVLIKCHFTTIYYRKLCEITVNISVFDRYNHYIHGARFLIAPLRCDSGRSSLMIHGHMSIECAEKEPFRNPSEVHGIWTLERART